MNPAVNQTPQPAPGPSSGSHRAPRPPRLAARRLPGRRLLVPALAAVVVAGGGGTYALLSADAAGPCAEDERVLRVAAAPGIAEVLSDLLEPAAEDGCARTVVEAAAPADVAAALAARDRGAQRSAAPDDAGPDGEVPDGEVPAGEVATGEVPDVWVPDSSTWLQRAGVAEAAPSLAVSPVVLAVVQAAATDAADVPALLTAVDADGTGTTRLVLPDPSVSAPTAALVAALTSEADRRPELRPALTRTLRQAVPSHAATPEVLLGGLTPDHVVPTSEQAVWAHNATGGALLTAVYGVEGGGVLDYPFAVLGSDPGAQERAGALLDLLKGPTGATALLSHGFRAPSGEFGADPAAPDGVQPERAVAPQPMRPEARQQAADTLATLALGSQVLAVIDVSGSMAQRVDGGPRRLDLVKTAATSALQVFPTGSSVGLWTFATGAPDGRDHRELVPLGPLAEPVGGVPRASLLASALQTTNAVSRGGTPLYDTTLAAVRELRQHWDPRRVNSVVLLTDGRNEDSDSISLDALLEALAAEADPARPVPVITIAYGPEADAETLARIADVTDGAAYVAPQPYDVDDVFLDAVGRRVCRPGC